MFPRLNGADASRAEQWLHKVYTEIEDRFLSKDKNDRRRAR